MILEVAHWRGAHCLSSSGRVHPRTRSQQPSAVPVLTRGAAALDALGLGPGRKGGASGRSCCWSLLPRPPPPRGLSPSSAWGLQCPPGRGAVAAPPRAWPGRGHGWTRPRQGCRPPEGAHRTPGDPPPRRESTVYLHVGAVQRIWGARQVPCHPVSQALRGPHGHLGGRSVGDLVLDVLSELQQRLQQRTHRKGLCPQADAWRVSCAVFSCCGGWAVPRWPPEGRAGEGGNR